jgi:S-formylglutathione hydrolase FrmB
MPSASNPTLALARELIALRSPTPDDGGCQALMRARLAPLGFDCVYSEGPGSHDWAYWDTMIERALEWLRLEP